MRDCEHDVPADGDCGLHDEDFRCAVVDCPRRVNPLEELLRSIEALTADFDAQATSLDECIQLLERDLTLPQEVSWPNALPAIASVLSYLGVFGFLMAFVYLRAYHSELLGNQPIAYGYLDTIVGAWQRLLTAASMLTGLVLGMASLSLSLSSKTRMSLRTGYQGARALMDKAAAVRLQYESWRPRIFAALEAAPRSGDSSEMVGEDEAREGLDRVGKTVEALETNAQRHWELVNRAAKAEIASWFALRLSQSRHRHRTWATLFAVQLVAMLAVIVSVFALSGQMPGVSRAWAGVLMYASVVVALGCSWLMASTADFANGPGSKSARIAVAQIVAVAFFATLAVLGAMGTADGKYAKMHPPEVFDTAFVRPSSGPERVGYLVPVISSPDTFLLTETSQTAVVERIPSGQIQTIRISASKGK